MKLVPALTAALCGFLTSSAAAAHASSSNGTSWAASRTILSDDFAPPQTFKNINLLRTINLEKSYVREQINVVIENIDEKPQDKYLLPFMREDVDRVGGLEVWDKNDKSKKRFQIKPTGWLPYRQVDRIGPRVPDTCTNC
jgi:oligosaccharyltransferase complex subunit alpha (ribophorin I)